jgi:hypothetical protein
MLGLVPLFSCYCLALVAALQQPHEKHRSGVLHGVKSLKAMCTIFTRLSLWHAELLHRGPWSYEWAPPMAQLMRDFSASFLVALCLEEPERIPEQEDVRKAVVQAARVQAADPEQWQQLKAELAKHHAQLDGHLTAEHVEALAVVMARAATYTSQASSSLV